MALSEIGGQARDRLARLDADFVRAIEGRGEGFRLEARSISLDILRLDEAALPPHLGSEKLFEDGARFLAPRDHQEPALHDGDSRRLCDLRPNVARASRAAPAFAGLLARDGDEAEIPDRGAVGLPVAIDHDDPLSSPGGRQSMRQSANAGADNGDIKRRQRRHRQNPVDQPRAVSVGRDHRARGTRGPGYAFL